METKNYNECMNYVENLEHFYVGSKLSQQKNDRIQAALKRFCQERNYQSMDSKVANCSSDKSLGETTLNTITKSPVEPSRENPFPLMVFSSRF